MSEMDKQSISYHPNGATHFAGSTEHNTRPAPDTPDELIWLRGFEAGVIRCRADRNQVIQELIEKAKEIGASIHSPEFVTTDRSTGEAVLYSADLADWLKSHMTEGE